MRKGLSMSNDPPDLDFDSSAPMLLFLLIVLDMTVGIRDIPYNSK
jgi:hypothetical protein